MKKDIERIKKLLQVIYRCGDRDECSIKHIGHGVSMMLKGLDPSVQDNYLDYSTAGCIDEFSDWENDLYIDSAFQESLWKEVYDMYLKYGKETILPIALGITIYADNYVDDY